MTRKLVSILSAAAMILLSSAAVNAQTVVAGEDFDGGDINLVTPFSSGFTVIPFTRFGAFSLDEFSLVNPAPFALTDDSVVDLSSGGDNPPFEADSEGIFGMARDASDAFFAVVSADSFDFPPEELMGSWVFDVSSADGPLTLNLEMGQCSNDSFDGISGLNGDNFVLFEYSFDGGPFTEAITVSAAELVGSGFEYRLFDSGMPSEIDFDGDGTHGGTRASGPAAITKTLVDTGEVDTDTILNKAPATGTGAGSLDAFSTPLTGSGNMIEIRISVEFAFEAFAFDNMTLTTGGGTKTLLGDVNCDGAVDLLDVAPFVAAVSNSTLDVKADINEDGQDDLLDVAPFVDLLTGN